jgi:hypothetical protein
MKLDSTIEVFAARVLPDGRLGRVLIKAPAMSAFGGKADIAISGRGVRP